MPFDVGQKDALSVCRCAVRIAVGLLFPLVWCSSAIAASPPLSELGGYSFTADWTIQETETKGVCHNEAFHRQTIRVGKRSPVRQPQYGGKRRAAQLPFHSLFESTGGNDLRATSRIRLTRDTLRLR
jgi:hypothetical protein